MDGLQSIEWFKNPVKNIEIISTMQLEPFGSQTTTIAIMKPLWYKTLSHQESLCYCKDYQKITCFYEVSFKEFGNR